MTIKTIVAALLLGATSMSVFAVNPKREMRSTWLTSVENIDWPSVRGVGDSIQQVQKKELCVILDSLEAINMTSTCLQVRSMADAMYPSKYAPWSYYLTNERGVDPGWNPLEFFVNEAHKRGIEAYVWLNPYRWAQELRWNTPMDKAWKDADMFFPGDDGEYVTFNPALPATRKLIVNVVTEILENYAVDGIIFDDYFYPGGGTTEGENAPDIEEYKSSGTSMPIGDWRRRNVNDMVADVYNAIQSIKPYVRFGISPAGVTRQSAEDYGVNTDLLGVARDWQYDKIYSDPLTWYVEGTVDFVSPQLYWKTDHKTNPFSPLSDWWSETAQQYNRHFYASHAVYYLAKEPTRANMEEMGQQVMCCRQHTENNAAGSIYFSTKNVNGPAAARLGQYLKEDLYATPALVPVVEWKRGKEYDHVENVNLSQEGVLSWTAPLNADDALIRYTVYAVPDGVAMDKALAADGDGLDVKYLQKVVYGTSYQIPVDKQKGYWYVVRAYDGYGREHNPISICIN